MQKSTNAALSVLAKSNDALPYAVVLAALLALLLPQSFAWFTPRWAHRSAVFSPHHVGDRTCVSCCSMYAPALGYLMFSIGVNLQPEAFSLVFKRPKVTVHHKQEVLLAQ